MLAYNVREAAHQLRVSPSYIRTLCRQGTLPHRRLGKRIIIPHAWLESFLLASADAPYNVGDRETPGSAGSHGPLPAEVEPPGVSTLSEERGGR